VLACVDRMTDTATYSQAPARLATAGTSNVQASLAHPPCKQPAADSSACVPEMHRVLPRHVCVPDSPSTGACDRQRLVFCAVLLAARMHESCQKPSNILDQVDLRSMTESHTLQDQETSAEAAKLQHARLARKVASLLQDASGLGARLKVSSLRMQPLKIKQHASKISMWGCPRTSLTATSWASASNGRDSRWPCLPWPNLVIRLFKEVDVAIDTCTCLPNERMPLYIPYLSPLYMRGCQEVKKHKREDVNLPPVCVQAKALC
jgi:hypothetical protein